MTGLPAAMGCHELDYKYVPDEPTRSCQLDPHSSSIEVTVGWAAVHIYNYTDLVG